MAQRPAWTIKNNYIISKEFEFTWYSGFAISQKQKCIKELHNSIYNETKQNSLEISTKSENKLGKNLSAFNLKLNNYYLENIFQSSKYYSNCGQLIDLLNVTPKDAKKDERHKKSGKLLYFKYNNEIWELEPKTSFYDYIYILSVIENFNIEELKNKLNNFDWFTDIEFNPKKSINCQARSITILKNIINTNNINIIKNKNEFINYHKSIIK